MLFFNPAVSTANRLLVLSFENLHGHRVRLELPAPCRDGLMAFAQQAVAEAQNALAAATGEQIHLVEAKFQASKPPRAQETWLKKLFADLDEPQAVHMNADDFV
jgi:hypothetical protein